MLKKIIVLVFISVNLCGCLAYNRIGIEEKNYSSPELKTLMSESYLEKNNIKIEFKGFNCPQIKEAKNKRSLNNVYGFLAVTMGTPYFGIYTRGETKLSVNGKIIQKNIGCNCRTFKLVSIPLIGGIIWYKYSPGKYKFNEQDATDYFLKEYESFTLEQREAFYKNEDDFLEMELLCNIFDNREAILSYLKTNYRISLIRKLEKRLINISKGNESNFLKDIDIEGYDEGDFKVASIDLAIKLKSFLIKYSLLGLKNNGDSKSIK